MKKLIVMITDRKKMNSPKERYLLLLVLTSIILSGCSNLKYLEEGEKLYTGSKININTEGRVGNKSEVISELEDVLRPKPNERLFGWRYRLWFYNIAGEEPKGPIKKFFKNRLGRPPVLWSDFDIRRGELLMENRLFNMGFFDAVVESEERLKDKTASARFTVFLKPAFEISELLPLREESLLAAEINNTLQKTLLRPGKDYSLTLLREERERISTHVRGEGYFYFNPDFIIFRADTTIGNREVLLSMGIKENIPENAMKKYNIGDITIDADYVLDQRNANLERDSVITEKGMLLLNNRGTFRPSTLEDVVFFEEGEYYSTRDHDLSLNHLMGLGVFKFVNIRFEEVEKNDSVQLDVNIQLTPLEKRTLGAEIRGVSKSTAFAGPGLTLTLTNRNLFGGAEKFNINLDGSYEVLLGGNRQATSLESGITTELTIPHFVAPFFVKRISPLFIPQTIISLSFDFLSRTDAFSLYSFRGEFGYKWNQSITTQHRFNPFVFNFFKLGTISPDYQRFFSQEVLLRRGLFEQFLLGSEYSFFYNSQLRKQSKHAWYFNSNFDVAGNLLYLLYEGLNLGTKGEDGSYSIFGQNFSQFAKSDFDLRYYLDMGRKQRLATRFIAGIGIPYGNSTGLPYVKLFTIGGSNSIRAFQPRALGPGGYAPPDSLRNRLNIFQSGEIKLEFNIEYRYDFTNVFKGAIFIDAGNVWNIRENADINDGQFKTEEFLEQVALGTGIGLRLDFTFFLLRLDLAFPLSVPYDHSSGYFRPVLPMESSWRRNNLTLNLAIGYPF